MSEAITEFDSEAGRIAHHSKALSDAVDTAQDCGDSDDFANVINMAKALRGSLDDLIDASQQVIDAQ